MVGLFNIIGSFMVGWLASYMRKKQACLYLFATFGGDDWLYHD